MADRRQPVRLRERFAAIAPILPVVAFVAAFAIVPAATLLLRGAVDGGGVAGLARVVADPLNRQAFANSLDQGVASAAAATLLGFPAGVLLGRYAFPGRRELSAVLLVPFLLPTLAVVLGVETLFGPSGLLGGPLPGLVPLSSGFGGIVTANVLYNAPVVALLTAVGAESAPANLEETVASLGGGPWASFRDAWGRNALLGAAAGAVLTFLFSALAFAAPLLLCGARCYTVEARIWSLDEVLLDPGGAALLSVALVALLAIPAAIYLFLLARLRAGRTARSSARRPVDWRDPSAYPWIAGAAVLTALVVGLLGAVLYGAVRPSSPGAPPFGAFLSLFHPATTARLGVPTGQAVGNTVFFATVAGAIAVLFGIATGFGQGGPRLGQGLRALVFAPLVVSPIVLSFSLAEFWRPVFGGGPSIGVLILLAQATLALPFALPAAEVALRRVPRSLRDSAQLLGARPWSAYLDVELPLVRDGLVTVGLFAFAVSFGEFTATYFLATPTFTTLPIELYRLEGLRLPSLAAAAAGLLTLVSLAAFVVIARRGGRVEL